MDEIAAAVAVIPGLNVHGFPADEITAPAAMVTYPQRIVLHEAFQRGTTRWQAGLWVAVDRVYDRSTRDTLSSYVADTGPDSVYAAIAAHDFKSCAYCIPVDVTFDVLTIAGTDYMAAFFTLNIAGPGTT